MSDSLQLYGLQYARLPCPSPSPRARSNSCQSSWWCHPTISSSVIPFSTCLQSFPESGTFPMSQSFTSGGQSIEASASTSVLPMNIQDWFSLGLTGLISLQPKGLSRVFSNTTVQKHQFFWQSNFFIVQLSHPNMTTGKTIALTRWTINIENQWSKYQYQEVRKMEGNRKNYKNKKTCIMCMYTYRERKSTMTKISYWKRLIKWINL